MKYRVKLDSFEGPFDLLVYLIESARMDIYDIEISKITSQYIDYLKQMQEIAVEPASEFMVLAANLMDIKSKMLLPRISEDGEIVEIEDPRTDLVNRILEYKRFKLAGELLEELENYGKNIFSKPKEDISEYVENPFEVLQLEQKQFISAFEAFLNKKKKVDEIQNKYNETKKKRITIEARMLFIEDILKNSPDLVLKFNETLGGNKDSYDKALSFVSLMELVRTKKTELIQEKAFDEILIKRGVELNGSQEK